ncbi:hypothetical protein A2U01_0107123, partial [Trifolium medium]|nr:hypothetical protein [Trifolium medium]
MNNQLSIVLNEVSGTREAGSTSQIAKNEGSGGIPKKRLRLDGESEVTNDSAG